MLVDASSAGEVAVAPVVADAVDDAGRGDRDPRHLHRPDRERRSAPNSTRLTTSIRPTPCQREARVDVALDPVVRRAVAVLLQRLPVSRFVAIELGALHRTRSSMPRVCGLCGSSSVSTFAWCLRWIATHSLVIMPVVSHSQKRKKWLSDRVQVERPVRLAAVQEDRDRRDRDVGHSQRDDDVAPPRQVDETMGGKAKANRNSLSIRRLANATITAGSGAGGLARDCTCRSLPGQSRAGRAGTSRRQAAKSASCSGRPRWRTAAHWPAAAPGRRTPAEQANFAPAARDRDARLANAVEDPARLTPLRSARSPTSGSLDPEPSSRSMPFSPKRVTNAARRLAVADRARAVRARAALSISAAPARRRSRSATWTVIATRMSSTHASG